MIARAIRNEMARGGQVFFVHNRVESIYSMGNLLQRLVPEARVVVGHGQMSEDALERAMLDFMAHKFDVLLATTIVENGLDIPNANTIIINRADRYGLSQLYQLRGRVGRSDRPAYAYLLIPPEESLSPVARKRLAAIKEFSDLGSGFRVAALDLEIRGAGNLLGGEQSGHIDAVGFEMYMKLLEETIRELKGEDLEDDVRATVNLRIDFRIDDSYVPDMNQRLMIYRRIAAARSGGRADAHHGGDARSLRPAADAGAQPRRLRPHSRPGRRARHREHRARRLGRRVPVPREGEGRSGPAGQPGPRACRPAAHPAGVAQDGPEEAAGAAGTCAERHGVEAGAPAHLAHGAGRASLAAGPRPGRFSAGAGAGLVDGAGDGRRGHRRLFEGGDPEAEGRGSRALRAASSSGSTELLEDLRDDWTRPSLRSRARRQRKMRLRASPARRQARAIGPRSKLFVCR